MYGMSDSSQRTGTWVITSIGEMLPAITQNLKRWNKRQKI